mmetsp:Transcript_20204/g.58561  ORF Transcript_20204/g.58561 Transcript_20204/m.58561 type:complete len:359 (-) Transcript_20204:111-1187(-)
MAMLSKTTSGIVALLAIAASRMAAGGAADIASEAPADIAGVPTVSLAEDDECSTDASSPSCAWNALQLRSARARAMSDETEDEEDEENDFDGFGGPGEADGKCGDTTYDVSSEGCCGGSKVFKLSTHACCGKTPYRFSKQGCCNKEKVFSLKDPHGCVATGAGSSEKGQAPSIADFSCQAKWPLNVVKSTWSAYCSAHSHKVWAMDHNCTQAWFAVKKKSKASATEKAMKMCEQRGPEKCFVFDDDGSVCGVHAQTRYCAGKAYDISSHGCCGGTIYKFGTHDCCGNTEVFSRDDQGCCAGKVYNTKLEGCCGGKKLFETETHGCCLNRGIQIYKMGTQNCCHRKGVCTIHHGEWSCC